MPLSPLSAAKTLCELSNWKLSNLEVNKLLYLAHMVRLGRTNGTQGLVAGHFEAWDLGPVLPPVYHAAKVFGAEPIRNIFRAHDAAPLGAEKDIIYEIYLKMRSKTPGELVAITHADGGAWASCYVPDTRNIVISNDAILREYKQRVAV